MTLWATAMQVQLEDQIVPRGGLAEADPTLLELAERGRHYTGADRYRAVLARGQYYRAMADFFERYDLLVSPTLAVPPFPHPDPEAGPSEVAGVPIDPLLGWLFTYPFNLTGQPAISMPAGLSREGLPMGVQIAGPRLADVAVLAAARVFEPGTVSRPTL
jgi:Asp-tRNA(Asn)/Glu-tRNA(Gln) amidotransferase A subunit family amidase